MPVENLDVVMAVKGARAAAAEIEGVAAATGQVGEAQLAASKKAGAASAAWTKQVAVLGALYAGYRFLKSSVSTTEDMTKSTLAFQRASGLDYKTSQAWVIMAKERGIQVKQLQLGMATLGRQMGGLTGPSKSAVEALRSMGLSQAELLKLPMKQRMDEIADAFKRMPNGPTQAAAAQRLFGRSGQQLLPILKNGSKAMDEQLAAIERLAPANAKTASSAMALRKQHYELGQAMIGVKMAIGGMLIPILGGLATALMPIVKWFDNAMQHSQALRVGIYALTSAIVGLLTASKVIVPVLRMLGLSELAAEAPIAPWVAGIAAVAFGLYYAYTKVKFFHDAVNAVVNFIKSNWQMIVTGMVTVLLGPLAGALVLIITHLQTFENVANTVVNAVKGAFSSLIGFFSGLVSQIAGIASGAFNGFLSAAQSVANGIINAFQSVWSFIQNLANSIGSLPGKAESAASNIPFIGSLFRQAGGPITSTGPYIVGEAGPEVVTLTRGQTVIPNHELAGIAGGGATIHTHVYLDRRQIALAVGRYTSDQQKRR